jgi:predicted nucleic acid-binding protein
MSLIYWDTMLFVYWLEEHPVYAERVQRILGRMEDRKDTLCTSSLAVGETLAGFYKTGERETAQRVREFFCAPFVKIFPFTETAADQYARIRGELRVASADAIHLACAAEAKVDIFLTNDRSLANRVVPGIQFIAGLDCNLF